ncbi:MAG: hypothetical protein ACHQJ6_08555 [Candidatus Berkiellales bacterium]
MNVGAFSCRAFGNKKPLTFKSMVEFANRSTVEFYDKENQDKYVFKLEDFVVNGRFPFPPD